MIVIFLGPPGSGKGTQAAMISKEFNLKILSTGDLLRSEMSAQTDIGIKIKEVVNSGKLVADEIVLEIIEKNFRKNVQTNGFVLDGFPRTIIQAQKLNVLLDHSGRKVDFVIELNVDQEYLLERLTNRFQCKKCGASYNKIYKPTKTLGVCDVCGSKEFIVRDDDKAEVIKKRFKEYKKLTEPLLPYYNAQGNLYQIDAKQEPQRVFEEISSILKNVLT